jgi:hypothetical protein
MKKKSDTNEKLILLLKELQDTYKKKIKHIRCDNAGENYILHKQCIDEEMGILFKYQPQEHHNKVQSWKGLFKPCWENKGNKKKRDKYWTEATLTLTLLENASVKKGELEMPHKKYHGNDPRYTNNLHFLGEIAVIKYIKNTKTKQMIEDIRQFSWDMDRSMQEMFLVFFI